MDVVLVELRRLRILRTGAVERVEVEARRPVLHELGRRDPIAERDRRLVEGQVVVDELPEIGEAGRHSRLAPPAARGHRVGNALQQRVRKRLALGAEPRETKRRSGSLDGRGERSLAAADALRE
jgi:hypothetical protein